MADDNVKARTSNSAAEIIPSVVQRMIASCNTGKCFQHLDATPIPSRDAVAQTIHKARRILFPGYFSQNALAPSNLEYCLTEEMTALNKALSALIIFAAQHDCLRTEQPCIQCEEEYGEQNRDGKNHRGEGKDGD